MCRLQVSQPSVDVTGQLLHETEDYLSWRWAPVRDVVGGSERLYPGGLPELLPSLLAREVIDEPFEYWS